MVTILFKHGNMAGTTDEIIMKRRSWLHFYPNIKMREIIIKQGSQLHNYPNMKIWQTHYEAMTVVMFLPKYGNVRDKYSIN